MLAAKFWVVLVIYAQCVLVTLFVWQLSWTENVEHHTILGDVVGLRHFENLWRDMIWYWVIVVFSVIQWNVNIVCNLQYRIFFAYFICTALQ